jgi:Nucleotide modification associated domain 2
MNRLFSYILRFDDGAAPNPFWGICTLTICKPAIRRTAQIGDWVIGTGSKNAKCNDGKIYDLSDSVVYAMKITDIKTLSDYDRFCNQKCSNKIPNLSANDWRQKMGDCIYDYSFGTEPSQRRSIHNVYSMKKDIGGINSLLSDDYYYFGEEARPLPDYLKGIIKISQGHKIINDQKLISRFENWIRQYQNNIVYADPQMRSEFDRMIDCEITSKCYKTNLDEDDSKRLIL